MAEDEFSRRVKSEGKMNLYWPEKEGDVLVGTYVKKMVYKVKGNDRTLYQILDENTGEIKLMWESVIISQEFERQQINIGERVGIRYLGFVESYKDFVVHVDRPQKSEKEKTKGKD